jgi:acyl-CoA hydrolase
MSLPMSEHNDDCGEATARKPVVTASIDRTDFKRPVYVGIAEVTGRIVGVAARPLRLQVELWAENIQSGERRLATVANRLPFATHSGPRANLEQAGFNDLRP